VSTRVILTDRCVSTSLTDHVGQARAKVRGILQTLERVAVGDQMITADQKQAV
jgi:hypothetical protein